MLTFAWVAAAQPKILYEKTSAYNTIVVTENQEGLRTLLFERDGMRQSVVKVGDPNRLELPYVRSMLVSLAMVQAPRRVLIIGLGGGTLASFLHRHYPQAHIDVVDVDPEVLEVARTFFGFREDETLCAHVADGRRFVEECRRPYDLILLDAYGAESVPYHLATREFLQAVRRALTPKGIAVGNLHWRSSDPPYGSMVCTYQEVFDQLHVLDVPGAGNKILFALPHHQPFEPDNLKRQAQVISQQKGFPFDLGELLRDGFRSAGKADAFGRVLTDKPQGPQTDREGSPP